MILNLSFLLQYAFMVYARIDVECRLFPLDHWCCCNWLNVSESRLYYPLVQGDDFFNNLAMRSEADLNYCLDTFRIHCYLDDSCVVPFSGT